MIKRPGSKRSRALAEHVDPTVVFAACSVWLSYPDAEQQALESALTEAVAALPTGSIRSHLDAYREHWSACTLSEREAAYVTRFDLGRRTSLHLTWYSHGDKRQRGQALVALKARYAAAGFEVAAGELPDYLPALLELAAALGAGEGVALLEESRIGIELLRVALGDNDAREAHLLEALSACLAPLGKAQAEAVAFLIAQGPPKESVGLEPFGPPEVMPQTALPYPVLPEARQR